jgi:tocopherol O-methyltransferase
MDSACDIGEIAKYYDSKTERIIEKYGPGPIVHYHTGIDCPSEYEAEDLAGLSRLMHEGQNRVLDMILEGMKPSLPEKARILDVGCGLGGGSIYAALKLDARIVGITIASEHVPAAESFARCANLSERVEFLRADAHTYSSRAKFDGVFAIESTGYMDRGRLFANMSVLMKPGAELRVFDWEIGSGGDSIARIDEHWKTSLGAPEEYRLAAAAADFELVLEESLGARTISFWEIANEWNRLYLSSREHSDEERNRIENSIRSIDQLKRGFMDGSVLSLHQVFRRKERGRAGSRFGRAIG